MDLERKKTMAKYEIKVLLDENRKPFIPFITADAIPLNNSDKTIGDVLFVPYTKEEIDAMFAALGTVQRLKGRVASVDELNKITNPQAGDVYIVGSEDDNAEYIYTDSGWERLGNPFVVDGYVKSVNGVTPDAAANVDLTSNIKTVVDETLATKTEYYSGTTAPTADLGKDGDIYILIDE